jgi:hypothetical protein
LTKLHAPICAENVDEAGTIKMYAGDCAIDNSCKEDDQATYLGKSSSVEAPSGVCFTANNVPGGNGQYTFDTGAGAIQVTAGSKYTFQIVGPAAYYKPDGDYADGSTYSSQTDKAGDVPFITFVEQTAAAAAVPDFSVAFTGCMPTFNADSATHKITCAFTIPEEREFKIELLESTCTTPATTSTVTKSPTTGNTVQGGGGVVTASVDINLDGSADIYTENGTTGTIAYCIRVEVLYTVDGTAEVMNYFEKPITATLDLAATFEVAVLADNLNDFVQDAEILEEIGAYTITASQCGSDGGVVAAEEATITQGQSVYYCVETSDEINLIEITSLVLDNENGVTASPIRESESNEVTSYDCDNFGPKKCLIETKMKGAFFEDAEDKDVKAVGAVLLSFGGSRRLHADSFDRETGNGEFDVTVQLERSDASAVGFFKKGPTAVMAVLLAGAFYFV